MATWNQDFEEFFALLNSRGVAFLLIGGVAYNFYAPPRATKDVDVWVQPTLANLERFVEAVAAFGFPTAGLEPADLAANPRVLMLGRAPNRIDILTRPEGLSWDEAHNRRTMTSYGEVEVGILSRLDLIACKEAVGRPRDLADVAMLRALEADE